MNYLSIFSKNFKHYAKNRCNISLSLIVSYLITGGVGYIELEARDLRPRGKNKNIINVDSGGPDLNKSANGTDVVNIVNGNNSGISHNKFIDLSVGTGNNIIFNNSTENGVSQTGGYTTKNANLTSSASTILAEVTGNNISHINGGVEVFGKTADFILANENGISVNGASFINTSGVTLTTGQVSVGNTGNIDFNVNKGNISIEGDGVGTNGDYFNIIADTVKLTGQITPIVGKELGDISIIAGKNKVSLKNKNYKNPILEKVNSTESVDYGIYGDKLGAMYGKNIKLISTGEGLGVRHEGLISASEDIDILSNGDIVVSGLIAKKSIDLKGSKSLTTLNHTYKYKGIEYNYSIISESNINLIFLGDIEIQSTIQSNKESINIIGRNLRLKEKTTARLLSEKDIKISLSGDLEVEATLIPKVEGRDPKLPPLIVLVDNNGNLRVKDPLTGEIYDSNKILWEAVGITGENIDINGKSIVNNAVIGSNKNIKIEADTLTNNKLIQSNNDLIINTKELVNTKDIFGKKIDIKVQNTFKNKGVIQSENELLIDTKELVNELKSQINSLKGDLNLLVKNSLLNNGDILGNNIDINVKKILENNGNIIAKGNLIIKAFELLNNGNNQVLEKYLVEYNEYLNLNKDKVVTEIEALKKKIELSNSKIEKNKLKVILNYYLDLNNKINILLENLNNDGKLGIISGKNIDIEVQDTTSNSGIINSSNDLKINSEKLIINNGVLESQNSIHLNTSGDVINNQRIYSKNIIDIKAKNFITTGDSTIIENEYKNLLLEFEEESLKSSLEKIFELEKKLETLQNESEVKLILAEIENLRDVVNKQLLIKSKLETLKGLGTIEVDKLNVQSENNIENSGVILTKGDILLNSKNKVINNGNVNSGNNLDINSNSILNSGNIIIKNNGSLNVQKSIINKDLTVGNSLIIKGNGFENNGQLKIGGNLDGTIINDILNTEKGNINIVKNLNLKGNNFINKGEIIIGENGLFNVSKFENKKNIDINKDLVIISNQTINNGKIVVGNNLENENVDIFENNEDLEVKNNIILSGNKIINNKNVVSEGSFTIDNAKEFINKFLSVVGDVNINADKVVNDVVITSNKNVNITGDLINNKGTINSQEDILLKSKDLINSGEIIGLKNMVVTTLNQLLNEGQLIVNGNLTITAKEFINKVIAEISAMNISIFFDKFLNESKKLEGNNILIETKSTSTNIDFKNKGYIVANKNLDINLKNNQNDFILEKDSKYLSNEKLTINTLGKIINENRFQNFGEINIKTNGDIINNGMFVSNKDINLKGNNVINNQGNTIMSVNGNIFIDALNNVYNYLASTIQAKFNLTIVAEKLENNAGTIKAGNDILLKVNKFNNRSSIEGEYAEVDNKFIHTEFKYESAHVGNFFLNKYVGIKINIPIFKSNMVVTDKAILQSGGNLKIIGKNGVSQSDIHNLSGNISASKDVTLHGNVINETANSSMSSQKYLEKIKVEFYWINKTLTDGPLGPAATDKTFNGNLFEALTYLNTINENDKVRYYTVLKESAQANEELKKLLNNVLGVEWINKDVIDLSNANYNNLYRFYAANGQAQIIAGKNINITGSNFQNLGGQKNSNTKVDVSINDENVESTNANLGVDINTLNSVKQVGNVKIVHDVEIITGSVTINGVIISASTGNTTGAIAVSGTISPIIFIDIPTNENGMFKPAISNSDKNINPMFETNIDFINPDDFYGSDYFFDQIGYNPNKPTTVIGDAYYETTLLNNMINQGLNYGKEVTADEIKNMLDNAVKEKDKLGLEVGKPLTPDQINNLETDIVWYVEMEVNGQIVLTPQLYLSKESRLKLAEDSKNSTGGSTVKAGNNIDIKSDHITNENSSISSGNNVKLSSENNIENIGGSIDSKNKTELDAKGDIIVDSTVGYDKNGNQIITNKGSISSDNIELSGDDITVIGGDISSKKDTVINSSGNVNIKDKNLISNDVEIIEHNNGHTQKTNVSSKSSGSSISGDNITINSKNDVIITGSEIKSKNDTNINAENNVIIEAGKNVSESKSKTETSDTGLGIKNGNIVISVKTETTEKNIKETTYTESSLSSGGNINISGKNKVDIGGGDYNSKKDINITGGTIESTKYKDSKSVTETNTKAEKGGGTGLSGLIYLFKEKFEKSTTKTDTAENITDITSEGNITIKSTKGDTNLNGVNINAKKDIGLESKGDVNITTAKKTSTEITTVDDKFSGLGVGIEVGLISVGANGKMELDGNTSKEISYNETNQSSNITSGGNIKIKSDNDVNITGSNVSGEKSTSIEATNDVNIKNSQDISINVNSKANIHLKGSGNVGVSLLPPLVGVGIMTNANGGIDLEASLNSKSNDSNIGSKGDLTIKSGKNVNIIGSNITGEKNTSIEAEDNVNIKNSQDMSINSKNNIKGKGSIETLVEFICGKKISDNIPIDAEGTSDLNVNVIIDLKNNSSNIKSGGNVNLNSGKNINIIGSDIKSKNDINIDSNKNINIKKSTDLTIKAEGSIDIELEKGIIITPEIKKPEIEANGNGSSIKAGNNVNINSKKHTSINGSEINSNGDTTINSKTKAIINSVIDGEFIKILFR